MIALPTPAHQTTNNNTNNDSNNNNNRRTMSDEWPSLDAAHGASTSNTNTSGEGDDWEFLVPADDSNNNNNGVEVEEEGEVVVVPRPPPPHTILRKNSVSAPDLRELDELEDDDDDNEEEEENDDVSSSVVLVSNPGDNPWRANNTKNKVSFKDAILSPSKHASAVACVSATTTTTTTAGAVKTTSTKETSAPHSTPRKSKIKSRYVVTPIQRCAKSTGDLLALAATAEGAAAEDEEPMGESDAMEYYHRKAHGAHGRSNGLKQRPDEAKRKEMIVQKKNLQRQKQGAK